MSVDPFTLSYASYQSIDKLGSVIAKTASGTEALKIFDSVFHSIKAMASVCGYLGSSSITPLPYKEWAVTNAVMVAPNSVRVLNTVIYSADCNQHLAEFAWGEQQAITDEFHTCPKSVRIQKERRGSFFSEVMAVNALAIPDCDGQSRVSKAIINRYSTGAQQVAHEMASSRQESIAFALDIQRILKRLHRAG